MATPMLPHCKRESQFELFAGDVPSAQASQRLELPIQRSQEVDVQRVARILGASKLTVHRMIEKKLLRAFRHSGRGARWIVEYDSVVDYCNRLRLHYLIGDDRLLRKPSRGRLRDEDVLPFRISETVTPEWTMNRLRITRQKMISLIEQGALIGYQLIIEMAGSPYRIYAPSVERYIASLHRQARIAPCVRSESPVG